MIYDHFDHPLLLFLPISDSAKRMLDFQLNIHSSSRCLAVENHTYRIWKTHLEQNQIKMISLTLH